MCLCGKKLKIVPGIALGCPYIAPHISPKRKHHIYNDRRSYRKERCIDKILTDLAAGDAKALANSRTNPKSIPFHEVLEAVHVANLEN